MKRDRYRTPNDDSCAARTKSTIQGPFSRMSRDGRLLALKCKKCGVKMSGSCIAPICKPCGGVDFIIIPMPRTTPSSATHSKKDE